MTTIAWDGKTLAADKCSWSGGVRRKARKVFKVEHPERGSILVAFCGNASFALQVLSWMRGEGGKPNPDTYFSKDSLTDQFCIAVDRDRRVWNMAADLHWQPIEDAIYALGAGQEFAWGALEAGATAVQAVEIAMKRSDYAGFGVDSVSFDQ